MPVLPECSYLGLCVTGICFLSGSKIGIKNTDPKSDCANSPFSSIMIGRMFSFKSQSCNFFICKTGDDSSAYQVTIYHSYQLKTIPTYFTVSVGQKSRHS